MKHVVVTYTRAMTTRNNNSSASFKTRLIAVIIALAVGFALGWLNGRTGGPSAEPASNPTEAAASQTSAEEGSTNDVTQEQRSIEAPVDESEDSASRGTTTDTGTDDSGSSTVAPARGPTADIDEDGWYTSKDEVALYIHTYGHLPGNFISKTKARARGWVNTEGNLDEVCPGMSIGGSEFYNDEGQLPDKPRRRWTECDINYHGGYRGAERIVFSNDGLVYYTGDHYKTFERLY